jgi:hypothetical protein
LRILVYTAAAADRVDLTGRSRDSTNINIMGDRSPKSVQKQNKQKQDKNSAANQKKQQATAAKQSPKK